MRHALIPIVFLASSLSAQAGDGPPLIISETTTTDTRAFLGLNWTFGSGGTSAEAVLGVARVKTDSTGDADGAKVSVHFPVSNGISFGKVKLTGMTGKEDLMAEAGAGFGTGGLFGTAGLWAPYVNGGVDFGFGGGIEGYAGVHSLDAWDVPERVQFSENTPD